MMHNSTRQKVGITGGAGFIGSELARHLANSSDVIIVDVKAPPWDLPKNVEYLYCDIRDYESVKRALKDVDIVIHTAIIQIPKVNKEKKLGYEVNVLGTQNVCRVADENSKIKGFVLAGSWHTIGEREIVGVVEETFGYRPDKVEDRARLYVLSKILQEGIVRFYDEVSEKVFGIIRMGTVLGQRMPEKTAANMFIERATKRLSITPYKHSMYRPMLYVDVRDVCRAFTAFTSKILNSEINKKGSSLYRIVNVVYPQPVTVVELAEIVREAIAALTMGKICPPIEIVDMKLPQLFSPDDKNKFTVDINRVVQFLGMEKLIPPRESIKHIIRRRLVHARMPNLWDSP